MRGFTFAVAIWFGTANLATAGLYESGEPYEFVPKDGKVSAQSVDKFRSRLVDLRAIAIDSPQPTALRKEYVTKRAGLSAERRRLSATELDVLGALYYRLFDSEAAMNVWLEASHKDPNNFAAYSNLALVKLARGELQDARQYDGAASSLKPAVIPGMTKEQSAWYFKVDKHLRQLIRKRVAEQGIPQDQMRPDDLFGVQFAADDGGYQAGQIAAALMEKLPEDDIATVQQLLLWLPHDSRLLWLLAELYNAHDDPASALTLLNDCLERGFHPKVLREHKQILQDYFDALQEHQRQQEEIQGQRRRDTFWAVVLFGGAAGLGLIVWQLFFLVRRIVRRT